MTRGDSGPHRRTLTDEKPLLYQAKGAKPTLGVVLLLAPVPARQWACAGFAITLGSALIAHLAVGDGPEA